MLDLDEIKDALCKGEYSSLIITWNDEISANYNTAEQVILDDPDFYMDENFVSLEEKQRCIDANSVWTAQWYLDTPIGFYRVHASTFNALYKFLIDRCKPPVKPSADSQ